MAWVTRGLVWPVGNSAAVVQCGGGGGGFIRSDGETTPCARPKETRAYLYLRSSRGRMNINGVRCDSDRNRTCFCFCFFFCELVHVFFFFLIMNKRKKSAAAGCCLARATLFKSVVDNFTLLGCFFLFVCYSRKTRFVFYTARGIRLCVRGYII